MVGFDEQSFLINILHPILTVSTHCATDPRQGCADREVSRRSSHSFQPHMIGATDADLQRSTLSVSRFPRFGPLVAGRNAGTGPLLRRMYSPLQAHEV
jgi:hypothetical protein